MSNKISPGGQVGSNIETQANNIKNTANTVAQSAGTYVGSIPARVSAVGEELTRGVETGINNAISTIGQNVDAAITTGINNATGYVENYISGITGKIDDSINNAINSTMGKIESKIQKSGLGKVDAFFGNPIQNSVRGIFGGFNGGVTGAIGNFFRPNSDFANSSLATGNPMVDRFIDTALGGVFGGSGKSGAGSAYVGDIRQALYTGNRAVPKATNADPTQVDPSAPLSFDPVAKKIKESYGWTHRIEDSYNLERNYVNRLAVSLIDTNLAHTRTYIFIGKPCCNIVTQKDGKLTVADGIANKGDLEQFVGEDLELFSQLNADISGAATPFITALQNRLVGISLQDATMNKSESAANKRGIRQEYPLSYAESMANVPITLTFTMDRHSEAFKLIYAWVKYIEGVKDGTYFQSPEDAALNRMGYTCPIWIYCCDEGGENIIFWTKFVGNLPLSIPFSVFSSQGPYNRDVQQISVQFQTAFIKPFDYSALAEFNLMNDELTGTKYFLNSYVPQHDRSLNYYWTSGAKVVWAMHNGRKILKLIHYSTMGEGTGTSGAGSSKYNLHYQNPLTGFIKDTAASAGKVMGGFAAPYIKSGNDYLASTTGKAAAGISSFMKGLF